MAVPPATRGSGGQILARKRPRISGVQGVGAVDGLKAIHAGGVLPRRAVYLQV